MYKTPEKIVFGGADKSEFQCAATREHEVYICDSCGKFDFFNRCECGSYKIRIYKFAGFVKQEEKFPNNFEGYLTKVKELIPLLPHLRRGQTYFNTLHDFNPELAKKIVGTSLDPFYVDGIIDMFLEYVKENWK